VQRVRIDLEPGASLIWGDLWFAGRYAREAVSELFQFEIIIQDFTVYREGRLVFRDRFVWRGPWDEKQAAWHFASQPACGSLFVTAQCLIQASSRRTIAKLLSFKPALATHAYAGSELGRSGRRTSDQRTENCR